MLTHEHFKKKKKKMLHLSDGVSMRASSLTTNLNEDCSGAYVLVVHRQF